MTIPTVDSIDGASTQGPPIGDAKILVQLSAEAGQDMSFLISRDDANKLIAALVRAVERFGHPL